MYKVDFDKPITIHFIGIGGISMSGIAEIMHSRGFKIAGSDRKSSDVTKHLEELGIKIFYEQEASNLDYKPELVVYTAAVGADNPEYAAAQNQGIPMLDRASFLGQLMAEYSDAVAIAGTHGKTTTTSMVSLMLLEGGMDPTIAVGGILSSISGNIRIGSSEHFVMEACEYKNSFLKFNPAHEIILNIEAEHLDFFKDIDDIRTSFRQFADKVPEGGNIVINCDIEDYGTLFDGVAGRIIPYGTEDSKNREKALYMARNISYDKFGCGSFDLYKADEMLGHIDCSVVGHYNIENCTAAAALALELGVDFDAVAAAAHKFTGAGRRFEIKGEVGGVTIIDDYAHHPAEVAATLTAAKRYPHKSLWCIFQPHTYTRAKLLFGDFINSLSIADKVVFADIYAAREADPGDISSKDFMDAMIARGQEAYYFPSFDEIEDFILESCSEGDVVITMGAGDIVNVGEFILGK